MKPSQAEFRSYELLWEPAATALLKAAGQPVHSPFLPTDPLSGEPLLKSLPDDVCIVTYEPGDTSDEIRAFRDSAIYTTGVVSEAAGFSGTLVILRRVAATDQPAAPGDYPECYPRLLAALGQIRSVLLDTERPFASLLPWYDVTSIRETAPNRQVDAPRAANLATLRFAVRFQPADGVWTD
jgi:hypothetical protein